MQRSIPIPIVPRRAYFQIKFKKPDRSEPGTEARGKGVATLEQTC